MKSQKSPLKIREMNSLRLCLSAIGLKQSPVSGFQIPSSSATVLSKCLAQRFDDGDDGYDDGDDGGGWHRGDNNKGFFEGDHA